MRGPSEPNCKTNPSLADKTQVGMDHEIGQGSQEEQNDANNKKQGNEPGHHFTLYL